MFGTKKQEAPPPVVPKPKLLELSVISPDDVTLNLGDEGVPATSPKPILAKLPSSESRRGSANFQKAAFTELVTELEKTSICGGKTYKAWSRKKLECSGMNASILALMSTHTLTSSVPSSKHA